jgi:Cu(I)/Ag(I) efflux system protein CusF
MKASTLICAATIVLSGAALADDMGGMKMDNMNGMKMDNMGSMAQQPAKSMTAEGVGVVKAVDTAKGTVTLAHQPIKEMHWPAMTMSFKVTDAKLLEGISAGQHVHFTLQGSNKNCVVTAIKADS